MRRGCISLGEIRCDACKRIVPTAERYLITDEITDEHGKKTTVRYCLACCEEKGMIGYRQEKDEKVKTFFPPDERPSSVKRPSVQESEESAEKAETEEKE